MLYVLLEGLDDERFFEKVMRPHLEEKYGQVFTWQYSSRNKEKIRDFIKTIKCMGCHMVFLADNDENPAGQRLQKVLQKFPLLAEDDVFVVVKEIESWYLAGVSPELPGFCQKASPVSTDDICKELFSGFFKDLPRSEIMLSILNQFDLESAKAKNQSLRDFCGHYIDS